MCSFFSSVLLSLTYLLIGHVQHVVLQIHKKNNVHNSSTTIQKNVWSKLWFYLWNLFFWRSVDCHGKPFEMDDNIRVVFFFGGGHHHFQTQSRCGVPFVLWIRIVHVRPFIPSPSLVDLGIDDIEECNTDRHWTCIYIYNINIHGRLWPSIGIQYIPIILWTWT